MLNYILPPHILKHIVNHGENDQKHWALATLTSSERIRGHREILGRYNLGKRDSGKFRVIQSADHTQNLIGQVSRKEGQAPDGDKSVDEAYEHTGDVYDFYLGAYNRNSLDGNGMKLFSTVHFGKNFNNAFWNGERMVFGDGDGKIFLRFTKCLEVIGHEMTHGVTGSILQLGYHDQPGAMNEAISDVFGSLSLQYKHKQTADQAEWIIGAGLFTKKVNGVGIRSLKAPGTAYDDKVLGKDPCVADMKDYVNTTDDNGGIHMNCGIPSHAFYLAAVDIGGNAWEKAGRVWYNTLTRRLSDPNTTFQDFADLTLKVSRKLFGPGPETNAFNKAWKKVGVI
jgi:Zn-dependent metalloprotease